MRFLNHPPPPTKACGRPRSAGGLSALRCFSGRTPLPLYAPPASRSSKEPNPFRTQSERLRVLVDRPLLAGPVAGVAELQGYPFLGDGSTGHPDAATVLRSYLGHPALEVLVSALTCNRRG